MADSDQAEVKAAAPLPPKPTRPLPQPRALSLSVTASSNDESTSNPAQPIDDSFEGIVSRIKGLRDPQDPNKLTPLRAHYLKKHLVGLQLNQEIHALSDKDALSTFGPPFSPSPNATRADLPLLRFLFHHFVLTFPFLRSAPSNFFSAKVQVFFNRFLSRNISSTDDRTETTKRTKVASKISKYASLLISSAVSVSGITGDEQVVKISESDRERISILETKLKRAINGQAIHEEFDVNVIGVRTVTSKGRLRNRSHEEFVIRTKRTGVEDVFVSRRYGDFIRLAETLRIEFPDEEIRPPPSKDRSGIEIGQERRRDARIEGGGDEEGMEFLQNESGRLSVDDQVINTPPSAPPTQTRTRVRTLSNAANKLRGGHSTPSSPSSSNANLPPPVPPLPGSSSTSTPLPTGPLAREKNRLTLRAYIRSLLSLPQVSESAALADFLLGEPVTLTNAEMEDARVREGLDELRASEASRFEDEASKRVKELKVHLDAFKEELIQPDGLTRIFSLIRSTPNLHDLPQRYLSLLSWARISLASTLFSLFMGSDTSSELFGQLKRIHGLMPYFMLRQILRISNPVSMIRGVLDLFLAQPFGGRSLAQRMVSGGLMDDVKSLGEICNAVARKVEDDDMCERVRCFVYASREVQETFRNQAKDEGLDLITVILRAPVQEFETIETPTSNASDPNKVESPPNPFLENLRPLNRSQIQKAVKASRAFERYKLYRKEPGEDDLKDGKNNEEDEFDVEGWGPKEEDEDAWLYEDLHVLLRMCTRLRDKEQLIELVFEGVTSELLKDMVTIFYSPLAQVYKAANIADSLYDLQRFIDDLIKTIEGCEEVAYSDPQAIVQVFIDLVARHEAKFYNFVHQVHSKGSGLFDGLMQWIELFINFVRGSTATNLDPDSSSSSTNQHPAFSSPDGTSAQQGKKSKRRGIGAVDLEVCLPAGGTQRQEALAEIDALVVHAYRLKYQREIKLRKRVVRREVEGAGNKAESSTRQVGGKNTESWNEDDDAQFVRAAVENLGVGDVFSGEVEEADEDSSAEEEEEEDEDAEFFDPNQEPGTTSNSSKLSTGRSIGHRRLASGEDEDASWRPPPKEDKDLPPIPTPNRSDSTFINAGTSTGDERQDKIDRERKRKGKAPAPRLPPLKHIPEMVPLFVEMLRPLLRPARTASGSSTTALADAAIASPPLPPPQAPARGGWW